MKKSCKETKIEHQPFITKTKPSSIVKSIIGGEDSSDEETHNTKSMAHQSKSNTHSKRQVLGDTSSEEDNPPTISKPQLKLKTKTMVLGDSSSDEELLQSKVTTIHKVETNLKKEIIIGNEDLSNEVENKQAEDNFEKNMKMKPRKEVNTESRKTVMSGVEATKIMFERQLAQIEKKKEHLQGKSKVKMAGKNENETKGASLKIMQDSSGKINISVNKTANY